MRERGIGRSRHGRAVDDELLGGERLGGRLVHHEAVGRRGYASDDRGGLDPRPPYVHANFDGGDVGDVPDSRASVRQVARRHQCRLKAPQAGVNSDHPVGQKPDSLHASLVDRQRRRTCVPYAAVDHVDCHDRTALNDRLEPRGACRRPTGDDNRRRCPVRAAPVDHIHPFDEITIARRRYAWSDRGGRQADRLGGVRRSRRDDRGDAVSQKAVDAAMPVLAEGGAFAGSGRGGVDCGHRPLVLVPTGHGGQVANLRGGGVWLRGDDEGVRYAAAVTDPVDADDFVVVLRGVDGLHAGPWHEFAGPLNLKVVLLDRSPGGQGIRADARNGSEPLVDTHGSPLVGK